MLALDPRIPDDLECFTFKLPDGLHSERTEWLVDGAVVAATGPGETDWLWPERAGKHTAAARIWLGDVSKGKISETNSFIVKGRQI